MLWTPSGSENRIISTCLEFNWNARCIKVPRAKELSKVSAKVESSTEVSFSLIYLMLFVSFLCFSKILLVGKKKYRDKTSSLVKARL